MYIDRTEEIEIRLEQSKLRQFTSAVLALNSARLEVQRFIDDGINIDEVTRDLERRTLIAAQKVREAKGKEEAFKSALKSAGLVFELKI
jgi:hypothetical protein